MASPSPPGPMSPQATTDRPTALTDIPRELQSTEAYRTSFNAGLRRLLATEGLGVFILVLANAANDARVWEVLEPELRQRFLTLQRELKERLLDGARISETDDDLMVMLKLMAVGFDAIRTRERRHSDGWELQYNPVRSFRPQRMTNQKVSGLSRPFDAAGFHFNKPFLSKEIFWEGELLGRPARLLFNKFPFEDLHAILVPEPEPGLPQLLDEQVHTYVWSLMASLGEGMPGVSLGYNGYGALASVNHRHFQLFVRERPFTVSDGRWSHRGGDVDYPLSVQRFDDARQAWVFIDSLHRSGTTYNLLYEPDGMICVPRRHQGDYEAAPWSAGFSFYELAGSFITFDRDQYESLDAAALSDALSKLAVG